MVSGIGKTAFVDRGRERGLGGQGMPTVLGLAYRDAAARVHVEFAQQHIHLTSDVTATSLGGERNSGRVGIAQDVRHLMLAIDGDNRHTQRTDPPRRKMQYEGLDPVRQLPHETISGTDTHRDEVVRDSGHPPPKTAIAPAPTFIDQCIPVAPLLGAPSDVQADSRVGPESS